MPTQIELENDIYDTTANELLHELLIENKIITN